MLIKSNGFRVQVRRRASTALVVGALALAGCGSDDGGGSGAPSGSSEGACALLTHQEVESAAGKKVGAPQLDGFGGCHFEDLEDDQDRDLVHLSVEKHADTDAARAEFESDRCSGCPAESDVSGLDDAFWTGGGLTGLKGVWVFNLRVRIWDPELSSQQVAAMEESITRQLAAKVVGRLP
jgi:hypothetical protein